MIDTESDVSTVIKAHAGQLIVKRVQDTTPYLEANKRERNAFQARRGATLRKVAEIPNIVVEQWLKEGINIFNRNDAKKVQQKLNSNEFAYLRTSTGKCKVT